MKSKYFNHTTLITITHIYTFALGPHHAGKSSTNVCKWCQVTFGSNAACFVQHVNACQRNYESTQFSHECQKQHKTTHLSNPTQEVYCQQFFSTNIHIYRCAEFKVTPKPGPCIEDLEPIQGDEQNIELDNVSQGHYLLFNVPHSVLTAEYTDLEAPEAPEAFMVEMVRPNHSVGCLLE